MATNVDETVNMRSEGQENSRPKNISVTLEKKSFAFRLYHLLSSDSAYEIIRWLPDGNGFHIIDVDRFTSELAPLYFKHTKLASFQRQLNLYGFRRFHSVAIPASYFHLKFQRGRLDLLEDVRRLNTSAERELNRPQKVNKRKDVKKTSVHFTGSVSASKFPTLTIKKDERAIDEMSELSCENSGEETPSLTHKLKHFPTSVSSSTHLNFADANANADIERLDHTFDSVSEINQYLFYYKLVIDGETRFIPYTTPEMNPTSLPKATEFSMLSPFDLNLPMMDIDDEDNSPLPSPVSSNSSGRTEIIDDIFEDAMHGECSSSSSSFDESNVDINYYNGNEISKQSINRSNQFTLAIPEIGTPAVWHEEEVEFSKLF